MHVLKTIKGYNITAHRPLKKRILLFRCPYSGHRKDIINCGLHPSLFLQLEVKDRDFHEVVEGVLLEAENSCNLKGEGFIS